MTNSTLDFDALRRQWRSLDIMAPRVDAPDAGALTPAASALQRRYLRITVLSFALAGPLFWMSYFFGLPLRVAITVLVIVVGVSHLRVYRLARDLDVVNSTTRQLLNDTLRLKRAIFQDEVFGMAVAVPVIVWMLYELSVEPALLVCGIAGGVIGGVIGARIWWRNVRYVRELEQMLREMDE